MNQEDEKEIDRLHNVGTFLNKRFLRVLFDYISAHEDVVTYTITKNGNNMHIIIATTTKEMFAIYLHRRNFTDYVGKKFSEYIKDVLEEEIYIRRIDFQHEQDFSYLY